MSDAAPGYPVELAELAFLDDGTEIVFRPILPQDADRLAQMHSRLSQETVYRRFFTAVPRPTAAMLRYFTNVDYHDRLALVASIGEGIVGVARYDRLDAGDSAELAVVVEDAWQGHGIGTRLLWRLSAAARERGVRTFEGGVLAENRPMLGLLKVIAEDVEMVLQQGEFHIRIHLSKMRPPA